MSVRTHDESDGLPSAEETRYWQTLSCLGMRCRPDRVRPTHPHCTPISHQDDPLGTGIDKHRSHGNALLGWCGESRLHVLTCCSNVIGGVYVRSFVCITPLGAAPPGVTRTWPAWQTRNDHLSLWISCPGLLCLARAQHTTSRLCEHARRACLVF